MAEAYSEASWGKVTMKRVLVVGGAGYIGGWLTDKLIEAGYETRVYDLLLYEERFLKDVDFIAGRRVGP